MAMVIRMKGTCFLLLLAVHLIHSTIGLICYTCNDAGNNEACNAAGTQTCSSPSDVCSNVIRDENGLHRVTKLCEQGNSCETQQNQNDGQCHPSVSPSVCRYCCSTDMCNLNEDPSVVTSVEIETTVEVSSLVRDAREETNCFRSKLMVHKENAPSEIRVIHLVHTQSAIRCVMHCMMEPVCISVKFDGKNTCYLNGISEDTEEDIFTTDSNMVYYETSQQYKISIHGHIGCKDNQEVGYSCQDEYVCCNIVENVNDYQSCENLICSEYITGLVYEYRFDNPRLLVGTSSIEFSVAAYHDVHICLSSMPEVMNPMYEIVIGGNTNTVSYIRRCAQCNSETSTTNTVVSPYVFTKFWISFDNGLIRVGINGEDAFMTFQDQDPLDVYYIGFSTGFGSGGLFRFCH
ncbi:uncharacterized protein LOC117110106 [Anneissia japonica]|uniref:uncharacterized protein LOC117110106 n=1 Tax=Anneissia japonica TaxID=1529436 RepID=UPI0014256547|nr:uncharacterized protein LOC117110106 [Anneissia japonica]